MDTEGMAPQAFARRAPVTQRIFEWLHRRIRAYWINRLYKLLEQLESDSGIVAHVKCEVPSGDPEGDDMQDAMRAHLVRMAQLFSLEGHSGFSASYAISCLEKLLRFEPLGPLTGEPSEWNEVGHGPAMMWQNRRCSHVFKRADGSAYDIDGKVFREPNGVCYTNGSSIVEVTFPYTPTTEYVDVEAPCQ